MDDREILDKLIDKVLANGWSDFGVNESFLRNHVPKEFIIYNQSFAKALWGKELISVYVRDFSLYSNSMHEIPKENVEDYHYFMPAWQHYHQQMIILPDSERLNYLKQFV